MGNADAQAIHDFWFGTPDSDGYGVSRKEWYQGGDVFDDACRNALGSFYDAAASGALGGWTDEVVSGVALCLMLDQYPRNVFRGTPKAFATDEKAREVSHCIIESALDRDMIKVQREFVYMPFMHSEVLEDQEYCVELFTELGDANNLDFAVRHLDIIQRFGRFPHRNVILGRESTAEETEFLTQPGSSF